MTRPCAFDGCPNPASPKAGGGLCNSHYWQKHKGRELTPLSYRRNQCVPWLEAHIDHDGDDCLAWPFQRLQDSGNAAVKYKGKQTVAARVMCEMAHGAPPTQHHEAAHSCGKAHEGCVNPKHLRWATHVENMADKIGHGTHGIKLTEGTVRAIRQNALAPVKVLVERFAVSDSHVRRIVKGETWRHV